MIHKIETELDEKTCSPYTLEVHKGDTIILQFDQDIWDIDEAQQLAQIWIDAYPEDNIMITFKGMEVKGVLHDKN